MSQPDDYAATFTALWPEARLTLGPAQPTETIRPSYSDSAGTHQGAIQALLPRPSAADAVDSWGDTLGEGGMGIVRIAQQASLQRAVAVKTLRPSSMAPAHARRLLQEAWITGLLEHPNIVPIYDIATGHDGTPIILMKRIEGRTWESMAADPDAIAATGTSDPVEWHCRTFLAVCNAVRYAHDHGILHRDIKPENVMIGAHGEVYLLDWGIALALDDRYGARLPHAQHERRIAGTPRFMAPEMALARGADFGPHTDVYLLGATLFSVLSGAAPHQGDDLQALLAGIGAFVPELPDHPPPLQSIVQRAMAGNPSARFADAGELYRAMLQFLEHRGSIALTHEGQEALKHLRRDEVDPAERSALQSNAAFAFRAALREWPDNPQAAEGLAEVQSAIDAEVAELAHRRRQADPLVGARTRFVVMTSIGSAWILVPLFAWFWNPEFTWWRMGTTSAILLTLGLGLGVWARESLMKTQLNRVTYLSIMLVPILQIFTDIISYLHGFTPVEAFAVRQMSWVGLVAVYAIAMVPQMWMGTLGMAIAVVFTTYFPQHAALSASFGNACIALNGYLIWRDQARQSKL